MAHPRIAKKFVVAAFSFSLWSASPVYAALTASDLEKIGVLPPPGARVPIEIYWTDDSGNSISLKQAMGGRPTILIFADYTCATLCGPILSFVENALATSQLASREYRLVVLGIDPKDGPREAATMKRERIESQAVSSSAVFLTADGDTIHRTAHALGYRFTYDAERDQFAHPAAAFVLSADGRVARVLSALGINGDDLRLALVEAGQGRIGTLGDQVRLLCYGFDPTVGAYTVSIVRTLKLTSTLTVIVLALAIGWLSRRPCRTS
jgi:protein SCO1/2